MPWPFLTQLTTRCDVTGADAMTAQTHALRPRHESADVARSVCPYCAVGCGQLIFHKDGKIVSKLVKLDWPIARIPTLAPHFGAAAYGPFNPETQMVPIIGLESTDSSASQVQTAEQRGWVGRLGAIHAFQRYPEVL